MPNTSTISWNVSDDVTQVMAAVNLQWEWTDGSPFANSIPVVLRTIVITFIALAIIFSNIINLVVLRQTKELPQISRTCLMNLGCADMAVGVIVALPCIVPAATGRWPYGRVWCQIAGIVHGMSCAVSIWSLAFVSIDRYLAVTRPLHYVNIMTTQRCYVILGLLWSAAFISFISPILAEHLRGYYYYRFSAKEVICGLYWGQTPTFCLATAAYIPILSGVILVVTSTRIAMIARQQSRRIAAMGMGQKQAEEVSKNDMKAIRVLGMTSAAYFVAWGPYTTVAILSTFVIGDGMPDWVPFLFTWVANANSFTNVVIYSVINSSFRKNAKRLLKKFFTCHCKDITRVQRVGHTSTSGYD